eukprot:129866-Pleurochrysis_carterae.AAC.1
MLVVRAGHIPQHTGNAYSAARASGDWDIKAKMYEWLRLIAAQHCVRCSNGHATAKNECCLTIAAQGQARSGTIFKAVSFNTTHAWTGAVGDTSTVLRYGRGATSRCASA